MAETNVRTMKAGAKVENVARLVPDANNSDTAKLFADLLRATAAGKVVGAIVIPLYPRGTEPTPYTLQLAGVASSNPTLAAGAMSACQVLVQELALQEAGLL